MHQLHEERAVRLMHSEREWISSRRRKLPLVLERDESLCTDGANRMLAAKRQIYRACITARRDGRESIALVRPNPAKKARAERVLRRH